MKKKILGLSIIILIILNCIVGSRVYAESICTIKADLSLSNPKPGQEFNIVISVKDITEKIAG